MARLLTDEKRITDFFACDVFDDKAMKAFMSGADYNAFVEVIQNGKELDRQLADKVADAMKEWAMSKGATHYTHWFQPLTDATAEKHDAFISIDQNGKTILEFSGKNLMRGEADASSFPSGGLRATFEARGYTIWDVTSPAFIKKSNGGAGVLCIPTAFCSFGGEALDKKTPLLRSMAVLDKEARRLLELIGKPCKSVSPNVGGEQEYFLISKEAFNKRDDLKITGRTLFGALPPKGQEKNDQYYAKIKEDVLDYMADLNESLWKLGITAKTQHNEVAPSQHELAPIFTSANIATDQNQLIMETMKKVADRHGLKCLLHEKPFDGISGSGKHNNWSLCTDDGRNLLSMGKDEQSNRTFLLFFMAVIAAVDDYQDLLRMSCASAGNDRRIGGHEAPPAIISVYVGDKVSQILSVIEHKNGEFKNIKEYLEMGVKTMPKLKKDDSDRNRTSPFAFTGNKFEFRMVGSQQTLSTPNVILNTIVADALGRFSDKIEAAKGEELDSVLSKIIYDEYMAHKRIIFNGNNYSSDWTEEAARRGLYNLTNAVDAFEALNRKEVRALFNKYGIFNDVEVAARYRIYLTDYSQTVNIEARTALSIAKTCILPRAMAYQGELAVKANALGSLSCGKIQVKQIKTLEKYINDFDKAIDALEVATKTAQATSDLKEKAVACRDLIIPKLDELRVIADEMELICDKNVWGRPNYQDILFRD